MLSMIQDSSAFLVDWPEHYYEITDIRQRRDILRQVIQQHSNQQSEEQQAEGRQTEGQHTEAQQNVDSTYADRRRLEILEKRFEIPEKGEAKDRFMYAWVMLNISSRQAPLFFQKKKREAEFRGYLQDLCLLDGTEKNYKGNKSGEISEDRQSIGESDTVRMGSEVVQEGRAAVAELAKTDAADEILQAEWENFSMCFLNSCIDSKNFGTSLFGILQLKDDKIAYKIAEEIDFVTRLAPKPYGLVETMAPLRSIMLTTYMTKLQNGKAYWEQYCRDNNQS